MPEAVVPGGQRVTGSPRDVRNNIPFLVYQGVNGGRFSHVRASHDSDFGKFILVFQRVAREMRYQFIK